MNLFFHREINSNAKMIFVKKITQQMNFHCSISTIQAIILVSFKITNQFSTKKDPKMKQSSKLLLASLLSFNLANFAMDQAAEGPEKPIDTFKRDIAALDNDDFKTLSRTFKGLNRSVQAFSDERKISFSTCQGLIFTAAYQELLKDTPLKALLEKYSLPIAHQAEAVAEFKPEESSCIHPVVLSLFSKKFQALIQKRKTALIQQKIEDGEEVEKWNVLEKKAFGMGLLNTEIKALKAEFVAINTKISPFFAALKEVKAQRKAQAPTATAEQMIKRLAMAMMLHDMLHDENGIVQIMLASRNQSSDNPDSSPKTEKNDKESDSQDK
jgi:hypothetical protein